MVADDGQGFDMFVSSCITWSSRRRLAMHKVEGVDARTWAWYDGTFSVGKILQLWNVCASGSTCKK